MTRHRPWILSAVLLPLAPAAFANDGVVPTLTLAEYVKFAVDKGIQALQTSYTLESAGYTKQVSLRQTDSPSLTAQYDQTRRGVKLNGTNTIVDDKATVVSLAQPTPLGTNITAQGLYGDQNKPGFNLSATQPIYAFTWNSSLRTRKRATLNFANARDTFEANVLSIQFQAKSLYYNIMLGDGQIAVQERKVSSSKKLLEITQALVQAGKTAPVETMRAKIRTQTDERQLQNAVTARDRAILNAKNYAYLPLEEPVLFVSRLEFKPFDVSLDTLQNLMLQNRPQLRALRRDVELARLATQEAIEPARPTIELTGGYSSVQLAPDLTRDWNIGGQAKWLFFDSFITRDQVRTARVNEWVANLNLTDAERTARVDVQNAYENVKNSEKQIQSFQFSREQARRNVEILRVRFRSGLERLIDVFDAENEMRDLENEYLGLLVNYNQAKDNLTQLIGVDVETLK